MRSISVPPLSDARLDTAKRWLRRGFRAVGYDVQPLRPASSVATHLHLLFKQLRVNCVLDVGANIGEYGRFLRRLGYAGRIVSFEPVAATYDLLAARQRDAAWSTQRLALGATDGAAEITVSRSSSFSSFRAPDTSHSRSWREHMEPTGVEEVPIRRLDSIFATLIADIPRPRVFLKMDTQGWDSEVLAGASGCLTRIAGIQTELSVLPIYEGMQGYIAAIAKLNALGFDLTALFPITHTPTLALVEMDGFFRRRERSAAATMDRHG